MIIKAILGLFTVVSLFLVYVSTREGQFHYERSGLIKASPESIYPYISDLNRGGEWSPFMQIDPNMKITINGSTMEWDGNQEAGAGRLEILRTIPNEEVEMKLTMTRPMYAENIVLYKLTREGELTRFSWSMSGDGGFMGKLISVFMNCEQMVASQFEIGIKNLKQLIEAK